MELQNVFPHLWPTDAGVIVHFSKRGEYTNRHWFIVPFLCCFITTLIGEYIVPPIYQSPLVYCAIPLLLHYYVDRRIHCATDLHHPDSTSLNPHPITDTFIWSFAVVKQYDSTTVNQRSIETMLFPICVELLSWLSGSVHHRFCKPLVRCVWKSHATLTLLAKQDCPLWLQYDWPFWPK